MEKNLTEYDVAKLYADAWNNLHPDDFIEILSDDVVYNSQFVLEEMKGKDSFQDYLRHKMKAVMKSGAKVKAEIGMTTRPFPNRDCVLLFQSNPTSPDAVIICEISCGKVTKIDLCMPEILAPTLKHHAT